MVTAVKTPMLKSVMVQGNSIQKSESWFWAYLRAYLKESKVVDTLGFWNSLGH